MGACLGDCSIISTLCMVMYTLVAIIIVAARVHTADTPSIDALSIYTTYVALNALHRVDIPDELRQQIEGIHH